MSLCGTNHIQSWEILCMILMLQKERHHIKYIAKLKYL